MALETKSDSFLSLNPETKTYLAFILGTEAAGGIVGWLTRDGVKAFQQLPQSALTPPPIVFPIAWTLLYGLMGYGAAKVYLKGNCKKALAAYFLQLAVNLAWSIIFFNLQAFGFAFYWICLLWGLILYMIICFRPISKKAANAQIPYLLWTTFAAYLTYTTWMLNS